MDRFVVRVTRYVSVEAKDSATAASLATMATEATTETNEGLAVVTDEPVNLEIVEVKWSLR